MLFISTTQLQEEELSDAILLVFANKQDLPNAYTTSEITEKLGLHSVKSRKVSMNFAVIFGYRTQVA